MVRFDFGLAFHFDNQDVDIYSGRQIDLDAYRYACKAFGVSKMACINTSGLPLAMNDESISFSEHSCFEDFIKKNKNKNIYILEVPWRLHDKKHSSIQDDLGDFDWIVVGPAAGWAKDQYRHGQLLTIKQNGRGALHGQHVATLVLGQIFLKENNGSSHDII